MQALTDRPLRLVGSLFWFVCAVLLLVRGRGAECVGGRVERGLQGGLWARFPRVSSSTSTVVFWLSQSGKALDSALGAGGIGIARGGSDRHGWMSICGSGPWLEVHLRGAASFWPRAAQGLPRSRWACTSCRPHD